MNLSRDDLITCIQALQDAAEAVNRARRAIPDLNLDHASERLRAMIAQHGQRLFRLDEDQPLTDRTADVDTLTRLSNR